MRILQINKYSYLKGGSEKYVFNIKENLEQAGHKVYLFSRQEPIKLGRSLFWSLKANKILQKIINEFKPDVAHCHNIYHDFSPSILFVLKDNKIPIVMTLHDYKIICPNYRLYNKNGVCENCKQRKYYNCFLNNCFDNYGKSLAVSVESYFHNYFLNSYEKNIDCYISPSLFLMKKIKEWGVHKKVFYLPNFVKKINKLKNKNKKDYLLYFGRLEKEKGIDFLIKTIKKIPQKKLLIAGKGNIKIPKLQNIVYLGFQSGAKLKKIITEAKAIIVPSLWYENNPFNVLESLALGTWVIASDIGGLPELIKPEINGQLFKAGDSESLIKAIQNLDNFDYSIQPQEIINKEKHINKLLEIYSSL